MSSATVIYQNGSAKITVTFKDFNDVLFTPKTLYYRVTNANGKKIVDSTLVDSGDYTTTWSKIFYGTALSISDPQDDGRRFLVVYGTFDTQALDDVPFSSQYEFPGGIKALLGS